MTYGLNLNMIQAWVVWVVCLMENKIISVERIFQYTDIPSEPPLVIESNRPDNHWPSQGEVDIRELQVTCLNEAKISKWRYRWIPMWKHSFLHKSC